MISKIQGRETKRDIYQKNNQNTDSVRNRLNLVDSINLNPSSIRIGQDSDNPSLTQTRFNICIIYKYITLYNNIDFFRFKKYQTIIILYTFSFFRKVYKSFFYYLKILSHLLFKF